MSLEATHKRRLVEELVTAKKKKTSKGVVGGDEMTPGITPKTKQMKVWMNVSLCCSQIHIMCQRVCFLKKNKEINKIVEQKQNQESFC